MSNLNDELGSDPGGEPITGVLRLTTAVTSDGRVRLELTTHAGDRYGMSLWPDEARAYAAMLDVSANDADRRATRSTGEPLGWSPDAATWSPEEN
jgi:hypothetical protein